MLARILLATLLLGRTASVWAQSQASEPESAEPSMPTGLEEEPAVPAGLDDEPAMPAGLDDDVTDASTNTEFVPSPYKWRFFADLRGGLRVQSASDQSAFSLGETRFQVHTERSWDRFALTASVTTDVVLDPVLKSFRPDLETGDGVVELREASLVASPTEWMDVKLGRQTLTWGTGDLLFINDMFPKDWNAFLIGRDMEYLKAPSDALKVSMFHSLGNLDLVYTPRFDADRFPDRRRLSSWSPLQQEVVGQHDLLASSQPDRWFRDGEVAARLYRRLGRAELALYGYRGFWKSPAGFDAMTGEATFPTLSVYGASLRRALLGGIAHTEAGYYDSRQDRQGDNPFLRNSEVRGLVGFEREIAKSLTMGTQYYVEYMRYHRAYAKRVAPGAPIADRIRHLATLRLSYLALSQRLRLTFFAYLSPSDNDVSIMPSASYAWSDQVSLRAGAKLFAGEAEHTFFGQLESNSNVYAAVRSSW